MPHVVRLILTGRQPRHFAGLRNLTNINEVQWSNGDTRRYLVVEWCAIHLRDLSRIPLAKVGYLHGPKSMPKHNGKMSILPKMIEGNNGQDTEWVNKREDSKSHNRKSTSSL